MEKRRGYKSDCEKYDTTHQRLRPHCDQLQREIRPRDCRDCGWYSPIELGVGAVMPGDLERLKEHESN